MSCLSCLLCSHQRKQHQQAVAFIAITGIIVILSFILFPVSAMGSASLQQTTNGDKGSESKEDGKRLLLLFSGSIDINTLSKMIHDQRSRSNAQSATFLN